MGVLRSRDGGLEAQGGVIDKQGGGRATVRQLGKVWDELLKLGFTEEDAEQALRGAAAASLPAVSPSLACERHDCIFEGEMREWIQSISGLFFSFGDDYVD